MRFRRRDVRTDDGAHPPPEIATIRPASGAWTGRDSGVSFCKLKCVRLPWYNSSIQPIMRTARSETRSTRTHNPYLSPPSENSIGHCRSDLLEHALPAIIAWHTVTAYLLQI